MDWFVLIMVCLFCFLQFFAFGDEAIVTFVEIPNKVGEWQVFK